MVRIFFLEFLLTKFLFSFIHLGGAENSEVFSSTVVHKVGDILCGTYGYSMTLPIFFEIVKVTKAQVVLKELKTYVFSGNYMQGYTMPCLGEYASEQTYRCGVNIVGIMEYLYMENMSIFGVARL